MKRFTTSAAAEDEEESESCRVHTIVWDSGILFSVANCNFRIRRLSSAELGRNDHLGVQFRATQPAWSFEGTRMCQASQRNAYLKLIACCTECG